jgi:hypothetical protein
MKASNGSQKVGPLPGPMLNTKRKAPVSPPGLSNPTK